MMHELWNIPSWPGHQRRNVGTYRHLRVFGSLKLCCRSRNCAWQILHALCRNKVCDRRYVGKLQILFQRLNRPHFLRECFTLADCCSIFSRATIKTAVFARNIPDFREGMSAEPPQPGSVDQIDRDCLNPIFDREHAVPITRRSKAWFYVVAESIRFFRRAINTLVQFAVIIDVMIGRSSVVPFWQAKFEGYRFTCCRNRFSLDGLFQKTLLVKRRRPIGLYVRFYQHPGR